MGKGMLRGWRGLGVTRGRHEGGQEGWGWGGAAMGRQRRFGGGGGTIGDEERGKRWGSGGRGWGGTDGNGERETGRWATGRGATEKGQLAVGNREGEMGKGDFTDGHSEIGDLFIYLFIYLFVYGWQIPD